MGPSQRQRLLRMADRGRHFTSAEARRRGIHTSVLTRLTREGAMERLGRGEYRLAGQESTQYHGLVLAAAAVPDGVICLLSALMFHGIGTQLPSEVWITRGRGTWQPRAGYPPIRIVRFSGEALTAGVEEHKLEGRTVRIYSAAKTIADCFKFRNKIGLDVALEALNDGWRHRPVSDGRDRALRTDLSRPQRDPAVPRGARGMTDGHRGLEQSVMARMPPARANSISKRTCCYRGS